MQERQHCGRIDETVQGLPALAEPAYRCVITRDGKCREDKQGNPARQHAGLDTLRHDPRYVAELDEIGDQVRNRVGKRRDTQIAPLPEEPHCPALLRQEPP